MKERAEDEWWIYIYELFREKPNSIYFKGIQYIDFYRALAGKGITFIK